MPKRKRNAPNLPHLVLAKGPRNAGPLDIQIELNAASEAARRRDPAEAERICRGVLATHPTNVAAMNLLAIVLGQGGRIDEAGSILEGAIAQHPNDATAHCSLGNVRWMQRRPLEAVPCFERAIALSTGYAEAHNNLAVALSSLGRHDDAMRAWDRAIVLAPRSPDAHFNRAGALLALGCYADAAEGFRHVLALAPRFADAHQGLGNACRALDRPLEAIESLERALALRPDFADAYADLGDAFFDAGNSDAAVRNYDLALAYDGRSEKARTGRQRALAVIAVPAPDTIAAAIPDSETQRRKATIEARRTDVARWSDPSQLERSWEARARKAAAWLPRGATIFDIGCGAMLLEAHLPAESKYMPCDVVRRDERTLVCDLNEGCLPQGVEAADRVVMLGVLEYVFDVAAVLAELRKLGRSIVCSYCCADYAPALDRRALGWVNAYDSDGLRDVFGKAGYRIQARERIDSLQDLLALVPATSEPAEKRVVVLSLFNAGNFGDRLGYHNICAALPPRASVEYVSHLPWIEPGDPVDLLVVGIGNSLFREFLTPRLLQLVERANRSVGIFGTQYRDTIEADTMRRLVDGLDHWFARYEEDALLYGRGRSSVTHLGDWLVDNFAMTHGTDDSLLRVGREVLEEASLDRTIQRIQRHKHVFSERLHPLLCALTSADTAGYVEQREAGASGVSGKFRSMLLDVFGRTYPEAAQWEVDRDAVRAYKRKVRGNIALVRRTLDDLLD